MMNKQETFTKVANHLLKQWARSVGLRGACKYRGKDGLMCAIGCLIPRSKYQPALEGKSVNSSIVRRALMLNPYEDKPDPEGYFHNQWLSDLQTIHDSGDIEDWPVQLANFAYRHNLDTTGIEGL